MCVPEKGAAQNDAAQAKIIGQIQTLLKELSKCAPHPDRPDQNGPLFLKQSADLKLADEHDSMLGMIAAESFLGSAFAEVASEAVSETIGSAWNAAEYSSAVLVDSHRGSFSLGQRRAIANDFNGYANKPAGYDAMMNAYLADLPQRMHLEKYLSHEVRRLYALRKNAPAPMPMMAA